MVGPTFDPFLISIDGEDFFNFDVSLISLDGEFGLLVTDSEKILDHDKRTASLLIEEFETSEILQRFVKALAKPANELEAVFFDLKNLTNIGSSVGVQLDLLGELVGEERNNRSDDEYRQAIYTRPNINRSYGEGEILILVLKQLTRANVIKLLEVEHKMVRLFFVTGTPIPVNLKKSMEAVADAGVLIDLSYIDGGDVFAFASEGGFPDDPGTLGFGETGAGYEDEGGKFAERIT
jgi:hypothetical protein